MNIEGLGEETVDLLFNNKLIRNYADLYELKTEDIIPLERLGEKSAANIINSIRRSASIPYNRVLYAIGIRHVGETVAKTIAEIFTSIDDLINADYDQLTSVYEIGPKIASSIIAFLKDEDNITIINRLKSHGLKLSGEAPALPSSDKLKGKTILISGVFQHHSRDEYKEIIEKNGGRNTTSLSASTSFILAGENMGPSKKEKALELEIPLISENEFLRIINE